jgi:LmbE family N-acetylglucosaminyl deacetylase
MTDGVAKVVLHVAPHPDDELIGAPAALLAMQDAGYRIVNVAGDLTEGLTREIRHAELAEACERVGFELVVAPLPVASVDPEEHLSSFLRLVMDDFRPAVVVSPSPHDLHPAHERVARATHTALDACAAPARWWMWGLWADLPLPSLLVPFDEARLERILDALSAHQHELARNDYRTLVRGRAMMNSVLGCERVFGYGSSHSTTVKYAELLTELVQSGCGWRLANGRVLHSRDPLPKVTSRTDIEWWLGAESISRHRSGHVGRTRCPPAQARR